MNQEFLEMVEEIADPLRKRKIRYLGQHEIVNQLQPLIAKRTGHTRQKLETSVPVFVGDCFHGVVGDIVKNLKLGLKENVNDPEWRKIKILHDHLVLRREWKLVADDLHLAQASFYEWRKEALDMLAITLWRLNEEAKTRTMPIRENLPQQLYARYVPRLNEHGDDYVEYLIDSICNDRAWFISSDGAPGVGKTTLVYETARRCLERELFDAIVWTSAQQQVLRPPEAIKVAEYVTSLGTILDITGKTLGNREVLATHDLQRKKEIVFELMAETNSLVIIDNVESLTPDAQKDVHRFLEEMPQPSRALITSRERHYIGMRTITLPGMNFEEAIQFIDLESARRNLPALSEDEQKTIFTATTGTPLAIQQILGLIHTYGYSLKEAANIEGQDHETMLNFMFDEMYQRLTPMECTILHVLPLFSSPATSDAIEKASGSTNVQVALGLGRLYKAFLVHKVEDDRYELLPFQRQFLRARQRHNEVICDNVNLDSFMTNAHQCLCKYYIEFLRSSNLDEQFQFLRWERKNILGLMEWCYVQQQWSYLIDLVDQISQPLGTLRYLDELMIWGKRAMEACEALNDSEQLEWFRIYCVAWPLTQLGTTERRQGRMMLEKSIKVAQKQGYGRLEALALRNIGRLLKDEEKYEEALLSLEHSFELWQALGDLGQGWLAHTLTSIGEVKFKLDRLEEAKEDLTTAWQMRKRNGANDAIIETVSDLAVVLAAQGNARYARRLSDGAISRAKTIREPARAYAYAQQKRAQLELLLDEPKQSIVASVEASRIYKALGIRHRVQRMEQILQEAEEI